MIEAIGQTGFYFCRCERQECRHEWVSRKKPKRCALCKYIGWNFEDKRFKAGYAPGAKIEPNKRIGKKAQMLQVLRDARTIIAQIIADCGPCDHEQKPRQCVCEEVRVLGEIDRQIVSLGPQPKPEAKGAAVA